MDWLQKIKELDEAETQTIQQAATETVITLWRWFTLEADRVYRQSPKAADTWGRHKEYRIAADTYCKTGNISAARAEFEKALTALQGATITQPDLLTT